MSDKDDSEREETYQRFNELVNMAPKEIEDWLETEDSKGVGFTREGEDEAVGHKSGQRIVEIKRTKKADLGEADYAHMRKVISYISRHKAQGPHKKEDEKDSKWRYSLMNWGHDPLKKS